LARANRYQEIVDKVDLDFVWRSVAAGFAASAIQANLAIAAKCAALFNDWPSVVRCIELSRAAESYEDERLETMLVDFADVAMELLGAQTFASRLLFDGNITVPARAGLQLCSKVDANGVPAPWEEYLDSFGRESKNDNTSYGEVSDREVSLAVLRGGLRVKTSTDANSIDIEHLARYLNAAKLQPSRVIEIALNTLGVKETRNLISYLSEPGLYALALAEHLMNSENTEEQMIAAQLVASTINAKECAGEAYRILRFEISADIFEPTDLVEARDHLFKLTRGVQEPQVQYHPVPILQWVDVCTVAARRDQFGLVTAEALIQGEGWYRCWLRFVIALCRAEIQEPSQQATDVLEGLRLLLNDLGPFAGNPRACDLYQVHPIIISTIKRAISLVSDELWTEATQILLQVSDETSTTIKGEMSGPLPRDILLDLIVSTSNSNRYEINNKIISTILKEDTTRRYYSDIAGFYLVAARLALMSNEKKGAQQHWESACKLLVAYGWRKDPTIYELLDPLDDLISVGKEEVQERLEVLQPLCKRVLLHTDGSGTRGARAQWWTLLADADPLSLAGLITPALLDHCNEPMEELEKARIELWCSQYKSADPFIAGVCRLTLKGGLQSVDADALDRLTLSQAPAQEISNLLRLLVARADEHPMNYSSSDNTELLEADSRLIEKINQVASSQALPLVLPLTLQNVNDRKNHINQILDTYLKDMAQGLNIVDFDVGVRGLSRAIDLWRMRPYNVTHVQWDPERFTNVIGYRLLELLQNERISEAELAIRKLADELIYLNSENNLLKGIAEGLVKHGFSAQAVLAYTLHWTSTRGRGGWMNFGGATNLSSLHDAIRLDAKTALEVLSDEIYKAILRRFGTSGISQALILAFGTLEWGNAILWPNGQTTAKIAFSAWDKAAQVIETRLPRTSETDDPDLPYYRTQRPTSAFSQADIALVLAILGGIGHPSREQKRRSLLAIQAIARIHPKMVCEALGIAFQHIKDPANTAWLLASIQEMDTNDIMVKCCHDHLTRLTKSQHLIVRTLSRQWLNKVEAIPEPPPLCDPIPELLNHANSDPIRISDHEAFRNDTNSELPPDTDVRRKVKSLLYSAAKARINLSEELVPRLRFAATEELVRIINGEDYKQRLSSQLESLCSRAEFRWPDAFIAPYEATEEVLQRLGGMARMACAQEGEIIQDPIEWEGKLAKVLMGKPQLLLAFESTRVPRPNYPLPPRHYDPIWRELESKALGNSTISGILAAVKEDHYLAGTTFLEPLSSIPVCTDPRYNGWRVIAVYETSVSSPNEMSWPVKDLKIVDRFATIEQRQVGDPNGLTMPPFGKGDFDSWTITSTLGRLPRLTRTGPLICIDSSSIHATDGGKGLGYASYPLNLSFDLVNILDLKPGKQLFELDGQDDRVAVVSRNWRACYVVSDYEMDWPILCGTDILIRPDLLDRISQMFGSSIVWREYIKGDIELIEQR
jgi:hypothetical protein